MLERKLKEYAKKRTVTKVSDFPLCVQYKICKIKEWIAEKYGKVDRIVLLGSYAKGTYIDDFTEPEFVDLKAKVKGHIKHSDFDILIYPFQEGGLFEIENIKIHIWESDNFYRQNTIEL